MHLLVPRKTLNLEISVFVITNNPLMFDYMFPSFFFFQQKLPSILALPYLFGTALQSYL